MLLSRYFRPATLLAFLAAPACSYDLTERPEAGAAPSALREVRWELRELGGQPTAAATEPRPFLILRDKRARVEGRADCNRFSGPYALSGAGQLRLGPLVTTRSACPELAAEGLFLQALNQARHYRISGSMLRLYAADTTGTPLASLQAVAGE